jgi:hypothetical protein
MFVGWKKIQHLSFNLHLNIKHISYIYNAAIEALAHPPVCINRQ